MLLLTINGGPVTSRFNIETPTPLPLTSFLEIVLWVRFVTSMPVLFRPGTRARNYPVSFELQGYIIRENQDSKPSAGADQIC